MDNNFKDMDTVRIVEMGQQYIQQASIYRQLGYTEEADAIFYRILQLAQELDKRQNGH